MKCENCGVKFYWPRGLRTKVCDSCYEKQLLARKQAEDLQKTPCHGCGKPFVRSAPWQRTCEDCKRKSQEESENHRKKKCDTCGKEFIPGQNRIRCESCTDRRIADEVANRKSMLKAFDEASVCLNCGSTLVPGFRRGNFCCEGCREAYEGS